MRETQASIYVDAPLKYVARLACDFGAFHCWHPAFDLTRLEGNGVGGLRYLDFGGAEVVERLEHIAGTKHAVGYLYSSVRTPLPLVSYRGTLHAEPDEERGGTVVALHHRIEVGDAPEDGVVQIVDSLAEMALGHLKALFEDPESLDEDEVAAFHASRATLDRDRFRPAGEA